jgi:8-oxo-dGTP pyrophosphatase MutT (NUDIX family)
VTDHEAPSPDSPDVGAPRERQAARVIVVDQDRHVLLLHGHDPRRPERGGWWFTPGGGREAGETPAETARRELFEETGHLAGDLGPVVLTGRATFEFGGITYRQAQTFFLLRVEGFEPDASRWTEVERASISGWRWWPLDDLLATSETVYPPELVVLLEQRFPV